MYLNSEHILEKLAIIPTAMRLLVLNLFLEYNSAFSLGRLEEYLYYADQSTIFRTLLLFETKGLLHSIVTSNGVKNYALCTDECLDDNHAHLHGHLKCTLCNLLFCVPVISLPLFKETDGFKIASFQIIANGTCKECNQLAC